MDEELAGSEEQVTTQPPTEQPETELSTPAVEQKPKVNKSAILGGILGLLVFAGALFAAYKFGQRQIQPLPSPTPEAAVTPTPDPTANWQVYTNTKYGYSIKYPNSWAVEAMSGIPVETFREPLISGPPNTDVQGQMFIEATEEALVSAKEAFEKEKSLGAMLEVLEEGEINVGGVKGYRAVVRYSQGNYPRGQIRKLIYLIRNDILYHIIYLEWHKAMDINLPADWQLDGTFNLMLSTFRFLDSSGSSPARVIEHKNIEGWVGYDNISGGYSIQYNPAEYEAADNDASNPTHSIADELKISCVTSNCQTDIWIRVYTNYDGGSRRQWLEEIRNISQTERYLEDVLIEGKKSLIAMDGRITEVAIPLANKMVSIEMKGPYYSVNQNKPVNIEFVYQFLSTFRFLD